MKNLRGKKGKVQGMRPRSGQQLSLSLESDSPDLTASWRNGMVLAYQGSSIVLCLDTTFQTAQLFEGTLHLPLPPGANVRQIQDAVEAWLQQEARRVIAEALMRSTQQMSSRGWLSMAPTAPLTLPIPAWSLSFSAQTDWVQHHPDGSLRFNWRLIEQSPDVIQQIVDKALMPFVASPVTADLWASIAS